MSPTLAASDRTVIPIYEGIQVYYTSNHDQYNTTINEYEHVNMILVTPHCLGFF